MDPILGSIFLFAGDFAPKYWALCNGQLLSISQDMALFSILGTPYGGDRPSGPGAGSPGQPAGHRGRAAR